jgi:hypothetical protein
MGGHKKRAKARAGVSGIKARRAENHLFLKYGGPPLGGPRRRAPRGLISAAISPWAAQGIAVETPQDLRGLVAILLSRNCRSSTQPGQIRGVGTESPVFCGAKNAPELSARATLRNPPFAG